MTLKDFELKYGYAPKGDVAEKVQITIGDKSYSAICMLGYYGVEAVWKHEGAIDGERMKHFIDDACAPLIVADVEWGIIDCAQINHTVDVKLSLERCFRGVWTYVPAYYPHLKPAEQFFALVKRFFREHEDEALGDPDKWIDIAFDQFRVGGPQAHIYSYCVHHELWRQGL